MRGYQQIKVFWFFFSKKNIFPSFDVDDLPAAPKRNGVPLLPVSNPAAQVTLELVNELRDALPWRAFCFGLVDSGAAPPNATARP